MIWLNNKILWSLISTECTYSFQHFSIYNNYIPQCNKIEYFIYIYSHNWQILFINKKKEYLNKFCFKYFIVVITERLTHLIN